MRQQVHKVIHVVPTFGPGGAERLVVDLLSAFRTNDFFEVIAVSLYPPCGTILEKEIVSLKLPVIFLQKRRGFDIRVIPALYSVFRSIKPSIVHTHGRALTYTFWAARMAKVPVIVHTIHSVASKESDAIGRIIRRIAFRSGVIPVSVAQIVRETVREVYGVESHLIYNGIQVSRFQHAQQHILQGPVTFINVARFVPPKNHVILLYAFARALQWHPDMQLLLVGDGPLRIQVAELSSKLGLSNSIHFLGIRHDIPTLLSRSDALVLPSAWEGFPMVILEAFASGRPVIATSVGGIPEIVKDHVNGILVPAGDIEALAHAMLDLAGNPSVARRLGRTGQEEVQQKYDISITAQKYAQLYRTALEEV